MFHEILDNVLHNLFKPLLLFFYLGFSIPLLKVPFEFPKQIYQGLTLYLLVAIGWHGGEELASLSSGELGQALGLMVVGFFVNLIIGLSAHFILRKTSKLRQIDAAAVAGYYGSDSAGTFVTALGVLTAANIAFSAYMPVMLAVMEIPGCLVALLLIARLRQRGMDPAGNMPGEPGYTAPATGAKIHRLLSPEVLRDVFLNPGLFLLLGGILVGYVARLQGPGVTKADDILFIDLFQGMLCLFLLEMGMTAARQIRDVKSGGPALVLFGVLAPNLFAVFGIAAAHLYALAIGVVFPLGTYVLFAVLSAAASYIAVPAIQRLAFPEASPTLPLAASLGLTFSYNVTIGIPLYIAIARMITGAPGVIAVG
ncbi:MAG TPA: sodium-dependent bicarbonate transport family permease [Nannocystaceae bacterium]|nr:sodium-dependent bicarbonate transport family permease [Nannocystaceae bacterium]